MATLPDDAADAHKEQFNKVTNEEKVAYILFYYDNVRNSRGLLLKWDKRKQDYITKATVIAQAVAAQAAQAIAQVALATSALPAVTNEEDTERKDASVASTGPGSGNGRTTHDEASLSNSISGSQPESQDNNGSNSTSPKITTEDDTPETNPPVSVSSHSGSAIGVLNAHIAPSEPETNSKSPTPHGAFPAIKSTPYHGTDDTIDLDQLPAGEQWEASQQYAEAQIASIEKSFIDPPTELSIFNLGLLEQNYQNTADDCAFVDDTSGYDANLLIVSFIRKRMEIDNEKLAQNTEQRDQEGEDNLSYLDPAPATPEIDRTHNTIATQGAGHSLIEDGWFWRWAQALVLKDNEVQRVDVSLWVAIDQLGHVRKVSTVTLWDHM